MSSSMISPKPPMLLEEVLNFVEKSTGLSSNLTDGRFVAIHQSIDGKVFQFKKADLSEVLSRVDGDGRDFIQVNFSSGTKVLFTDTLVGFKPKETFGLDMGKIPKVVTTPDLLSVFEAIEESVSSETPDHEIEILRKVFQAILHGGETAGFDLSFERRWLIRLVATKIKASA